MSQWTGTLQTYDNVGIREDLTDTITRITPEDTVFVSSAGVGPRPMNTYFEWQEDALRAPNTSNAHPQGDRLEDTEISTPPSRHGNHCQISRESVSVSGTNEAANTAGRASDMAYQTAKKIAELKRDIESICLSNQAASAGAKGTAKTTGSLLAFIKTNTNFYTTDGADPSWTDTPDDTRTDGTVRAFAEDQVKDVAQKIYEQGGRADMAMVSPVNKINFSGFTGIAEHRVNVNNKSQRDLTIYAAADVYRGDFGELAIVPNRLQRDRDVFLLDSEHYSMRYYRPLFRRKLGIRGDADETMLLTEWGLEVNTEKGLGGIYDLNGTRNN